MPKYQVDITKRVNKYAEVVVEAEHPDDAKERVWDVYDTLVWREKQVDGDIYVTEIKYAKEQK